MFTFVNNNKNELSWWINGDHLQCLICRQLNIPCCCFVRTFVALIYVLSMTTTNKVINTLANEFQTRK
jgi:hypothetical protein